MKSKETFASLLESFRFSYDIPVVFDDFLTLSLCAVTRNPITGLSHYEDLYMETIAKYAQSELRFHFPNMFNVLVEEMDERSSSTYRNDILGEYFEQHLAKDGKSQFFTPWPICEFMAKCAMEQTEPVTDRPKRILEPACGSGRLLLAAAKHAGPDNEFYGIDIDHTCVKMTALNLFLNGVFHAEVMCGNALLPDDFKFSYVISLLPFGVFRIDEKEKSRLWHLMRNTLEANRKEKEAKQKEQREKKQALVKNLKLPSESGEINKDATQTTLF